MQAVGMNNVVLTRVDDRLVHGQVMTSWQKATGANKFMVVDDEVAANDLMKTVLKGVVSSNVKLGVFTIQKAADRLIKGFKPTDKVIILVKTPLTILELSDAGIDFKTLNIGGMGISGNRKTFYQNIACSDEELDAMRTLIKRGCNITVQIVVDDPKKDVAELLK
ncbi:PTS sugar transporter subunit IIB [Atopobium sp. oral taxon 416]|jgi:mannose/fructose/N-acetylgalactosamine-specific phosphotransferase system component IIB|uniref:PTS sugar transporter subunit IIB n=1 Tax=Atopobium sp. oral taxon 416 TaxID=712157 RepID=UPI001BAC2BB6|nr:PTS sugar transporter subunit IIB [Atopobium sp. oral taxon 416]QUC04849.1 PTS sugar transporter subunit IIB [Atopobium sp. oral taxon 416]